ncbi:hypothetical protein SDC9_166031 [bioreactor metagenome]|uniref:Uncharacterized protein n=1 Tax=bioreactor metagenome TaxID=1076179 RepID=A0A645FVW8_9ZZZZ
MVRLQGIDDRQFGTGGFERNDVRIHVIDILYDLLEFAVAHMRMHLRLRSHATVAKAECRNRPIKVLARPFFSADRQLLLQSRFIDLDDFDARFLQIENLFADRQTDLESHLPQRNVLTRERPIQDCHRTSEHPFDRFVGKTLRIFRIEHGDRVFASDVPENDRRLDASCSVGLYPSFFGKHVSSQVFAEEFNHVVALGFAVDQHIQPQFLLQIDAFFDEAFDVFIVFGF